jgi:hypothetical protein
MNSILSRDQGSRLGKQVEWFYSENTKLRREAPVYGKLWCSNTSDNHMRHRCHVTLNFLASGMRHRYYN